MRTQENDFQMSKQSQIQQNPIQPFRIDDF